MPPKQAPEPSSKAEPLANLAPAPVLIDGIAVPTSWLKQLRCIELDPINDRLRERSANIRNDKKLQMIQSEGSLKASSSCPMLGRREFERQQAQAAQDRHLRRLSSEAMVQPGGQRKVVDLQLPQATRAVSEEMQSLFKKGSAPSSSPSEALDKGRRHNTTRLVADLELDNSALLHRSSPKLRCDHLDRIHGFYNNAKVMDAKDAHARRDQAQQQPNAYMTFAKNDRTMSGSLRAEPNEQRYAPLPWEPKPSQKPSWLAKSIHEKDA